jgi:hypothetical protein
MGHYILVAYKERERAGLLRLAADIVETGKRRNSPLSPGQDAMVLELVKKAQALEHEIIRLQKNALRAFPSKHGRAGDA